MDRKLKLLMVGLMSVAVTACATAQGGVPLDGGDDYYGGYEPDGYHTEYVVTRAFKLHTSPNVNAHVADRIPESTRLIATVHQVDDVWYHIEIAGGPDGYMFGLPLHPEHGPAPY